MRNRGRGVGELDQTTQQQPLETPTTTLIVPPIPTTPSFMILTD